MTSINGIPNKCYRNKTLLSTDLGSHRDGDNDNNDDDDDEDDDVDDDDNDDDACDHDNGDHDDDDGDAKQYTGIKDLFFCKGSTAQKTRSVCETTSPAPSAATRLHKQLQAEKHRRQIHAGAQGLHSGTQCNTLFLC